MAKRGGGEEVKAERQSPTGGQLRAIIIVDDIALDDADRPTSW